jgi:glycine C-acetyltransferase
MNEQFVKRIGEDLKEIESAGLLKKERIITSDQG